MSLANLQLRTEAVEYNGTTIALHGLSANAIAGLILSQLSNLEEIFDIVEGAGVKNPEDIANLNVAEVGQRLLVQLPDFIAHVIAYSAHEPEHAQKIIHLDAATQMKCLKHIASLTFTDEAGFREFVGNVVAALRSAKGVVPQRNNLSLESSASPNGGSASAQPSLS
jgi:hypothetical protein